MTESASTPSSATGHRERLRARFMAGDVSALEEAALLELLLTYSIPRRDVRSIADALLVRFGTIAEVLAAEPGDLQEIAGINEVSTALLKLVQFFVEREVPKCAPHDPPEEKPEEAETMETRNDPHRISGNPPATKSDEPSSPTVSEEEAKPLKRTEAPKLQLSNGYSLDSAQNARLITHIADHPAIRRFARRDLMEGTGLAEGQVESITGVAVAMGLVVPVTAVLTPLGELVHRHDLFLDSPVSLEFCHFLAAGNSRNLIWHAIFNELLPHEKPMDQAGWSAWLRAKLAGGYSDRSLVKHVASEVRFILDAYTVRNFKRLNLIYETPEKTLSLRRYSALQPHTLAAMIYWIGVRHQARLVSFSDLQAEPGSPGRVFGLDASSMRQLVENLHQKGWIRYEVRHGLDQIRLLDNYDSLEFIAAAYEAREPEAKAKPDEPDSEMLLL
jgi:hypothetical protein